MREGDNDFASIRSARAANSHLLVWRSALVWLQQLKPKAICVSSQVLHGLAQGGRLFNLFSLSLKERGNQRETAVHICQAK